MFQISMKVYTLIWFNKKNKGLNISRHPVDVSALFKSALFMQMFLHPMDNIE